MLDCSCRM